MIRNGGEMNKGEQQKLAGRQAAVLQTASLGRRIPGIERAEQQLSALVVPSTALLSSRESFITDWADS